MIAPCKDCTERHTTCHSECQRYKEYQEYRAKLLEKKRKIDGVKDGLFDLNRRHQPNKNGVSRFTAIGRLDNYRKGAK